MSYFDWLPRVRARRGAELAEEMRTHLAMAERDLIARGESPADAAAHARRQFGNPGLARETARDQWSGLGRSLEHLEHDVRFALRMLTRARTFTAAAVLTVAIGVGGSTALFSVVDATLLRPLPYPHAGQLVRVEDDYAGAGSRDVGMSTPEWKDLQRSGIFEHVSPVWFDNNNLTGLQRPQRVGILIVAPNFFSLLGVSPQLGSAFDPNDRTAGFNEQIVISDGLWKRAFGGDSTAIGRVVQLDSDSYRVVGVMPAGFQTPGETREERSAEVWVAFGYAGAPLDAPTVASRASLFPGAIARVSHGVPIAEAQRRIDALVTSLRRQFPADYPREQDWHLRLVPLGESVVGDVGRPLVFLLAAVGLVLLIGCANIANLLLARASTRGREMAVRQALGGSTARSIRQLLTESVVLALVGGVAGVVVVCAARGPLTALVPASMPRLNQITIDWRVLAFALGASLLSGLCFGLAPALRIRRIDVTQALRQEGRGSTGARERRRTRRILVAAEFALSLVLLSASGLIARSVWDLAHAPLGFEPRGVSIVRTRLPYPNDPSEDRYGTVASEAPFVREVIRRARSIPGVRDVALGSGAAVPLDHPQQDQTVYRLLFAHGEGGNGDQPRLITGSQVTPEYFRLLRMTLLRGRLLEDDDTDQSPSVVVVNEAMAQAYWPHDDPIGQRIKLSPRATSWSTIVGIVANARTESLASAGEPHVYASLYQRAGKHLAIFVQGGPELGALEQQLRDAVQSINSALPVFGAETLAATVDQSIAVRRLSLDLIGVFAAMALLLSLLGIYGVTSYLVSERTQEIGVRMALGADATQLVRMMMAQGLRMALAGAAAGVVGALIVSRLLSSALVGVRSMDVPSLAVSAVLLMLGALIGCYLPARRVVRVQPWLALRG